MTRLDLYLSNLRNYMEVLAAILAVGVAYAMVGLIDENTLLRADIQTMRARACPGSIDGKPFAFLSKADLPKTAPGYIRLTCYYRPGVKS